MFVIVENTVHINRQIQRHIFTEYHQNLSAITEKKKKAYTHIETNLFSFGLIATQRALKNA